MTGQARWEPASAGKPKERAAWRRPGCLGALRAYLSMSYLPTGCVSTGCVSTSLSFCEPPGALSGRCSRRAAAKPTVARVYHPAPAVARLGASWGVTRAALARGPVLLFRANVEIRYCMQQTLTRRASPSCAIMRLHIRSANPEAVGAGTAEQPAAEAHRLAITEWGTAANGCGRVPCLGVGARWPRGSPVA